MTTLEIKEFLDKEFAFNIAEQTRKSEYVNARYMYYFFAFKYSSEIVTNKRVGNAVNRDHASVMHGMRCYKDFYETDKYFREVANRIEDSLKELLPVKLKRNFEVVDNMNDVVLRRKVKNLMKKNVYLQNKINSLKQAS